MTEPDSNTEKVVLEQDTPAASTTPPMQTETDLSDAPRNTPWPNQMQPIDGVVPVSEVSQDPDFVPEED